MINTSSSITLRLLLEYICRELQVLKNPKSVEILSLKDGLEAFFESLEIVYKEVKNQKELETISCSRLYFIA